MFYILSLVEMCLAIDYMASTKIFFPLLFLVCIDVTLNGLLIFKTFKVFSLDENNNSEVIPYESSNVTAIRLYKIQINEDNELLNNNSNINIENTSEVIDDEVIINDDLINDNEQICPICFESSDEYYIYHFYDNCDENLKYKNGCLSKSHFVCKTCASNRNINLKKCVICRKDN